MKTLFIPCITAISCFLCIVAAAQSDELDSTFGVNGKVTTSFGTTSTPHGVAIQLNNRIVVAGVSNNGTNNDFAVARYKANGQLDPSFGTGGKVTTDLGGDETGTSVNIWKGKIVVAGYNDAGFCIIRYNPLGVVDSTFGDNGHSITTFGGNGGSCFGSAIQSDGKIIAVGFSSGNYVIVRYNVNGRIDRTFGAKGIVTVDSASGYFNSAQAVAVQPDGKIVVTGFYGPFGSRQFLTVRCNADGSLDNTFGTKGKVYTDFGSFSSLDNQAFAIAIGAAGKIYAAGQSTGEETGNFSEFSIARYKRNGNLDSTFNSNGKVLTDFDGFDDGANAIVVMPSGKVIVVGTLYSPNLTGIVRYRYNGTLDPSFGNHGKLKTDYKRPTAAALQGDGKYLVTADDQFTIVRYKAEIPNPSGPGGDPSKPVDAIAKTAAITLAPNPVRDVVKINDLDPSVTSILSIIDASGRTLLHAATTDKSYSWNVASLQPGVYYLHIIANRKITDLKFVKE
jgi:uncharacterized delta-60 repeat protein